MSELETEDIFVADGGSVTTYAGAYIVAFTVTPAEGSFSQYAYFFVVDAAGNKLSEVRMPPPLAPPRRHLPLCGEGVTTVVTLVVL